MQVQDMQLRTQLANYADATQMALLLDLLNGYAQDPMGGGHALAADALARLPAALRQRPALFSVLAYDDAAQGQAVGLVNCVEGFSTFAAMPLVNVHDVVVVPGYRGRGVARVMLHAVESIARQRGACKLTLEVLSGNQPAIGAYTRAGFAPYQLDPRMGTATFMQKWLDEQAAPAAASAP
jgi:ribosomal protein S18 acetylase RimI-like enzyme